MSDVAHDERAVDDVVLEQQGHGDEGDVEKEHDEGQAQVQAPLEAGDGHDDEDQHHEEDDDGAGHAAAAHLHGTEDQSGQEPRHRKAVNGKRDFNWGSDNSKPSLRLLEKIQLPSC